MIGAILLGIVTAQRLIELIVASANTRRLLRHGGIEHGRSHYPAIVLLHAGWLGALWILAWDRAVDPRWLIVYAGVELGRVWVLATLGRRWTTRIIVIPGETPVRRGPYRFVPHPNYVVVAAEIAVVPLALGLIGAALIFSSLNLVLLGVRIRAETIAWSAAGKTKPAC